MRDTRCRCSTPSVLVKSRATSQREGLKSLNKQTTHISLYISISLSFPLSL